MVVVVVVGLPAAVGGGVAVRVIDCEEVGGPTGATGATVVATRATVVGGEVDGGGAGHGDGGTGRRGGHAGAGRRAWSRSTWRAPTSGPRPRGPGRRGRPTGAGRRGRPRWWRTTAAASPVAGASTTTAADSVGRARGRCGCTRCPRRSSRRKARTSARAVPSRHPALSLSSPTPVVVSALARSEWLVGRCVAATPGPYEVVFCGRKLTLSVLPQTRPERLPRLPSSMSTTANPAGGRHRGPHQGDVGGLVGPAPVGNGGQVGGVGLHQEPVEGRQGGRRPQVAARS